MKGILCTAAVALAFVLGGNNYAKAGYFDPGASLDDQSVTLDKCSGVTQCLPNLVVPGYIVLLKDGDCQDVNNWADVVEFNFSDCNGNLLGTATQYGHCEGFSCDLIDDVQSQDANTVFIDQTNLCDGQLGAYYEAGNACYTIVDPCQPCDAPAVPLPLAALMAPAAAGVAGYFGRKMRRTA